MAVVLPSLPNATKRKGVNTIDMQDCLGKIAQLNLNNMHGSTITWARAWILLTPMTNIFVFLTRKVIPVNPYFKSFPLGKMASISQTIFSDAFSWLNFFCIVIKISLKFVPNGPINN